MKFPFALITTVLVARAHSQVLNVSDMADSIVREKVRSLEVGIEGDTNDFAEGAVIFQQQFKDMQEINGVQLQIQVQIQIGVVTSDDGPVPPPVPAPVPPAPTPPAPVPSPPAPSPSAPPPDGTCAIRTDNCENPQSDGLQFCSLLHTTLQNRQDEFQASLTRWERLFDGDLSDVDGVRIRTRFGPYPECKCQIPDVIDDILLCVTEEDIPGPVIGRAGRRIRRTSDNTAILGVVVLDSSFIGTASRTLLSDLITHEVGHVLGLVSSQPVVNADETEYLGAEGLKVWQEDWGCSGKPPLQGRGHWDEPCFTTELMTPTLNSGSSNQISAMTVAMLKDIGFPVSEDADPEEFDPDTFLNRFNCCSNNNGGGGRRLGESNVVPDIQTKRRLSYDPRVQLNDQDLIPDGLSSEDFETARQYALTTLSSMASDAEENAAFALDDEDDEFGFAEEYSLIELYVMNEYGDILAIEFELV